MGFLIKVDNSKAITGSANFPSFNQNEGSVFRNVLSLNDYQLNQLSSTPETLFSLQKSGNIFLILIPKTLFCPNFHMSNHQTAKEIHYRSPKGLT
jgi:hypothetical protein